MSSTRRRGGGRAARGATPKRVQVVTSKADESTAAFARTSLFALVNAHLMPKEDNGDRTAGAGATSPLEWDEVATSLQKTLDKKYGQGWNVVIGDDLEVAVRYMKDALVQMRVGTSTVLAFKCATDAPVQGSLPVPGPDDEEGNSTDGGDAGAQSQEPWAQDSTSRRVGMLRSGMSKSNTRAAMNIIAAARKRNPGDSTQFLRDCKTGLTKTLGSTWHLAMGKLGKSTCAALASDLVPTTAAVAAAGSATKVASPDKDADSWHAMELQTRVGKHKLTAWRETAVRSGAPVSMWKMSRWVIYLVAVCLAAAWFLTYRSCNDACLPEQVVDNPAGCPGGLEATERTLQCHKYATYMAYAAVAVFMLAPAIRIGRKFMQKLGGGGQRRAST